MERFLVLLCFLVVPTARADYSLPPVDERLVLFLEGEQLTIADSGKAVSIAGVASPFSIERFWLQDRIWGDGICVGVKDTDPKSAPYRIKEIVQALAPKSHPLTLRPPILLELVREKGSDTFIVTYLKVFDADVEFSRYFPNRQFYDTVPVRLPRVPHDSSEFTLALKEQTKSALNRLMLRDSAR